MNNLASYGAALLRQHRRVNYAAVHPEWLPELEAQLKKCEEQAEKCQKLLALLRK